MIPLLCRLLVHRWGKWEITAKVNFFWGDKQYDTGIEQGSRCEGCGRVRFRVVRRKSGVKM